MRVGSSYLWSLLIPIALLTATVVVALSAMGYLPPVPELLARARDFLERVLLGKRV